MIFKFFVCFLLIKHFLYNTNYLFKSKFLINFFLKIFLFFILCFLIYSFIKKIILFKIMIIFYITSQNSYFINNHYVYFDVKYSII